jgi:HK97 family phage major capsid protein
VENNEKFEETINSINEKAKEIREAVNSKASTEEVEGLKNELKALKEVAEVQGNELSKIKTTAEESTESFADGFKRLWKENADKIKSVKSGSSKGTGELSLKVSSADVQNSTLAYSIDGIGKQPVKRIFLDELFNQGQIGADSGGIVRYWDQDTLSRNADNVAECGVIPESSINWIEQTCPIEKIADSIPVCAEAIEDFSFIESEVRNFLLENVLLKNDSQILLGTGVSPQYKGIDSVAQSWAAGSFANAIASPTIFDVIKTAKTQVENSGQNNLYMPNVVLMNPTDYTLMMLEKDGEGQYLFPMYMSQAELVVDGMRVIPNQLVTQNTLYVMDSTKGTVYNHRGLAIDMATQHGTDFLSDTIRLRATLRKAFVIRNVHANAFLKVADIDASKTALTKP